MEGGGSGLWGPASTLLSAPAHEKRQNNFLIFYEISLTKCSKTNSALLFACFSPSGTRVALLLSANIGLSEAF